jgi:Predicted ATPase with chaperone activity
MVTRVATVAFEGIEARAVDVQVQIAPGNVAFTIVGLPDKAVAESRERVRAALMAAGLTLPAKRITVNLAPADLPKEGSHYDLPIALAVMAAIGAVPADALAGYTVIGELALDASIAPVAGVLPRHCRQCARPRAHLPRCLRARGGVGERRPRHSRAALPRAARQPLQGHTGHGPALAGGGAPGLRPARPEGHQGPGERQEGA